MLVQASGGPTPTPAARVDGDGKALLWTITIALTPLLCDIVVTAVIGARPLSSISLFHIGLSVFGLTLAALVRILSHGRGSQFLPILFMIAVLEVLLALYFGGTFAQHAVRTSHIEGDISIIEHAPRAGSLTSISTAGLTHVRDDLSAVEESDPKSPSGGLAVLAGFGIFSWIMLIAYWGGPTGPERLQVSKAARGGP